MTSSGGARPQWLDTVVGVVPKLRPSLALQQVDAIHRNLYAT